jgi:hypothetical protein
LNVFALLQLLGERFACIVQRDRPCLLFGEELKADGIVGETARDAVIERQDDRDEHEESRDREHDSLVPTQIKDAHAQSPIACDLDAAAAGPHASKRRMEWLSSKLEERTTATAILSPFI